MTKFKENTLYVSKFDRGIRRMLHMCKSPCLDMKKNNMKFVQLINILKTVTSLKNWVQEKTSFMLNGCWIVSQFYDL